MSPACKHRLMQNGMSRVGWQLVNVAFAHVCTGVASMSRSRCARLEEEVAKLEGAPTNGALNVVYLKNVVVCYPTTTSVCRGVLQVLMCHSLDLCVLQLRYMSFDAKSGERKSLVPVIATLLSFTDEEVGPHLLHAVLHLVFGSDFINGVAQQMRKVTPKRYSLFGFRGAVR